MGFETLAIGASLGGSALSATGKKKAAAASAAAYLRSARQRRAEAQEARALSNYRSRLMREDAAELLSSQQAETGHSRLAMTGTALAVLIADARKAELAIAMEKRAGAVEAQRHLAAAEVDELSAGAARRAGSIGAISSLLGMASLLNPKANV